MLGKFLRDLVAGFRVARPDGSMVVRAHGRKARLTARVQRAGSTEWETVHLKPARGPLSFLFPPRATDVFDTGAPCGAPDRKGE